MACWTQQAVRDISDIYMKEMNVQLQQKFSSIIELRLQQVSGVIATILQSHCHLIAALFHKYLPVPLLPSEIPYRQNYVLPLSFADLQEKPVHICSLPADLNEVMFFDEKNDQVYTHVIDLQGNFVIRNGGIYQENYFHRMKDAYGEEKKNEIEKHVRGLKNAMEQREEYSMRVSSEGEKKTVYCSPLPGNTRSPPALKSSHDSHSSPGKHNLPFQPATILQSHCHLIAALFHKYLPVE